MNVEKRNKYVNSLYGAIHTLSGRAEQLNVDAARQETVVKSVSKKKIRDLEYYYLQLNLNKVTPGSMIKSYTEFSELLQSLLDRIEATELNLTRADMSINTDNENDYELFKKLNRLLICCIAEAYSIENCYKTENLWSDRSLSVAIKNDVIEAENYNKELESKGLVETTNRLELRSKRMTGSIDDEFLKKWFSRLDLAIEKFQAIQDHYNRELARIWLEDTAKPPKEKDFVSVTAFLLKYKDCIFCRKQLVNLLKDMGIENYESKARKFKEKHSIEFYSLTDLKIIVKAIKSVIQKYFDN